MPWKTVTHSVDTDTGEILASREANNKNVYQLIKVTHDYTNHRTYTRYYTKFYTRKKQLSIWPEGNTTSRNDTNRK